MNVTAEETTRALVDEARRRIGEESRERLRRCLAELDDEEIWRMPGPTLVSIGNLVLHLAGNVRQWIVAGLGGGADDRVRAAEFEPDARRAREEVLAGLDAAVDEALAVLERLEPAALTATHRVQGFEETGTAIVVHVIEHFSYHVGQISLLTKLYRTIDLDYYGGQDLDATES